VFWQAVKELRDQQLEFRIDTLVKLYGKLDPSVQESIARWHLEDCVEIHDYIPHSEIIYKQKSARVLYLSVNDTANALGILTGKIYEYLAVRRPILCIGPEEGEAAKVVKDAQAGLVSGFEDLEKLKANILAFYRNYQNKIPFAGGGNFTKYSRKTQTGELAGLLDKIT